jgi:lipopolysaccharide export LptBFGC system permease protein LptF
MAVHLIQDTAKKLRKLRKNFKDDAIAKAKNHRDRFLDRKKMLAEKFYSRLNNIQKESKDYRETKDFLKLYDKFSFVLGVFIFGMFAYIMGRYPNDFFYTFYKTFIPLLIFIRFVDYKPKKLHYFLTDFCYWAGL